ncbi:hypothetical protein SPRG_16874 [Saprolegnia parasitica CBS 223.65]|uniref:GTP-binding nuclear protein n=1 Tax=Saprolegnia parasitica (strain CBS 223.65) TaxID=695850 RepID=A0A067BHD3_SAPPC|nr:hypothetical protein SPRG_16874 [Saprolegnia parasitica CBS 223.65]KDO17588.1 hypothetical protein SPRG_16874 [Saprolegnia parasitica CBS 223.65]|eukprot:XP_012211703.1 hypothetical protein SPRG_16874 [Saprolegnia parasitica CBS 223.65]
MSHTPEFKLLLVGDGGVGKSALIKRHLTGQFDSDDDVATLGVEVHPLLFDTNFGEIKFSCWDIAGQKRFGGLRDGYYVGAQCAIIMFDATSRISYKNVPIWHRDIVRVCEDIPIVLCGSKIDAMTRKVQAEQITFHRKKNLPYCEISAKTDVALEMPFLYLARKLIVAQKQSPDSRPTHCGPKACLFPMKTTTFSFLSGVGKTTFLQRHVTGEFKKRYIATLGVKVHPLQFDTNFGPIKFNCWDFAGQGSHDDHYADAQCAIIMFDVTSRVSYKNVPHWYRAIRRVCEDIPIVLCGNKVDAERHNVKQITFHREKNLKCVEMSVKANYNIEKPFLWLARKLAGDDKVKFIEVMGDPPPMPFNMDPMEAEMKYVMAPLPDDDDDEL